jgi:hypothetical protein
MLARIRSRKGAYFQVLLGNGSFPLCRTLGRQFLCLLDKRFDASDCSLRGIATNEGVGSSEFTRKPLVVD